MRSNFAELPVLLACLMCGAALGIAYDILRLPRAFGKKLVTALCDLAFCLIFFGLTAFTLVYADMGRLRFFELAAIFFGAIIWQTLPGRLIRITLGAVFARLCGHTKKNKRRE